MSKLSERAADQDIPDPAGDAGDAGAPSDEASARSDEIEVEETGGSSPLGSEV